MNLITFALLSSYVLAQEGNYTDINPLAKILYSSGLGSSMVSSLMPSALGVSNIGSFKILYNVPVAAVHVALLPGGTWNPMIIIDRNIDWGGMAVNDGKGGQTDSVIWDHWSQKYYGGIK